MHKYFLFQIFKEAIFEDNKNLSLLHIFVFKVKPVFLSQKEQKENRNQIRPSLEYYTQKTGHNLFPFSLQHKAPEMPQNIIFVYTDGRKCTEN